MSNEQALERVYPSAPLMLTEEDVLDKISKERVKAMLKEINYMKLRLLHYQKLELRYMTTARVLRGCGYITGVSLEGVAIGLQFTLIGLPISLAAGALGLAIPILVESIIKMLNIKKENYNKKISHIKEYLDKLYIFIEEAKADKIISLEELKTFQTIIDNFNKKGPISEIKEINEQPPELKDLMNLLVKIINVNTK